jgi:hypothetical protein
MVFTCWFDHNMVNLTNIPNKSDAQKFVINKNGTISPQKAPGLVLGMQATSLQHDAGR